MILVACLLPAGGAQAGAWLRQEGEGFASLSFGLTHSDETTNALYIEYGLSNDTTIGLDISTFTNAQNARNGFGNLFLRRSLGRGAGPHRFAYSLGVGGLWGNEKHLPTLNTGLSWGYGFTRASGWVNVDLAYILEPQDGESIAKMDGTFGLNFSDVTTGLLEFTISRRKGVKYGAVQPSLLFSPEGRRISIKVGAEIPYNETERSAIKLGIWRRF